MLNKMDIVCNFSKKSQIQPSSMAPSQCAPELPQRRVQQIVDVIAHTLLNPTPHTAPPEEGAGGGGTPGPVLRTHLPRP